ncbi:MAG: hypothetical protein ABSG65_20815 [Bryobacteraceae bacterium]
MKVPWGKTAGVWVGALFFFAIVQAMGYSGSWPMACAIGICFIVLFLGFVELAVSHWLRIIANLLSEINENLKHQRQ